MGASDWGDTWPVYQEEQVPQVEDNFSTRGGKGMKGQSIYQQLIDEIMPPAEVCTDCGKVDPSLYLDACCVTEELARANDPGRTTREPGN